ncbi:MAG: class II glutamine amidotransferase [Bdellovibrionaceae bacterium]|nr:class II glutamine amidotransferase [Pseudobdellovibrionaceae bacterium]
MGMSCNVPTDICFSFTGFRARGGRTDVHKDGWGIAFFEDRGVRMFVDPSPSFESPIAELVRNYPIKSKNVVAHIRRATRGVVALENTHPFQRELWGRYWVFAHNGTLPDFQPEFKGSFSPVGATDSERAFCAILERMEREHKTLDMKNEADVEKLFETIHAACMDLGARGEFNFLMSSGRNLIAHCSTTLSYILRKAPWSTARLKDEDVTIDFQHYTTETDRVAVVATSPLTENETWIPMKPGTLTFFKDGELFKTRDTVPGPPKKIEDFQP